LEEMRRELVEELKPMSTPLVAKSTRLQMWRLHVNDPVRFSVRNLARRVGVTEARAHAILVGEGLAQSARERGEFVGDTGDDDELRKGGFEVREIGVEPPRDRSIAETPHRVSEALISGEVDEIEVQRLVQGETARERHAVLRAKIFPADPPPSTPEEAIVSRPVRPATRRTLRGQRKFEVMADKSALAADPMLRTRVRVLVTERDGSVRTASWADRRALFGKGERQLRGLEMEPLEHLRKYVNTPIHFRGRPIRTKRALAELAALRPISPAEAIAAEDAAAAASGNGIAEQLLRDDERGFVDESAYSWDDKQADLRNATIDHARGQVVRKRDDAQ
jgi:hypothetical protein